MLDKISSLVSHAKAHAQATYPFECCGLIDQDGIAHRCENIATNRTTSFRISSMEAKRLTRSGSIAGIYHSHVDENPYLSRADIEGFGAGLHIIVGCFKGLALNHEIWFKQNGKMMRIDETSYSLLD